jgi:hypothetical protein
MLQFAIIIIFLSEHFALASMPHQYFLTVLGDDKVIRAQEAYFEIGVVETAQELKAIPFSILVLFLSVVKVVDAVIM